MSALLEILAAARELIASLEADGASEAGLHLSVPVRIRIGTADGPTITSWVEAIISTTDVRLGSAADREELRRCLTPPPSAPVCVPFSDSSDDDFPF